ncbi:MAG TPA: HNH endonuclease, partial [Candidatus Baltobacteraceae bacterium]|nr:HNH endonuclease [Candidatus Baltobacteraceae bacterium]
SNICTRLYKRGRRTGTGMQSATQSGACDASALIEILDYLAPTLDTYEQALYFYIYRHSRLVGITETVIGFKSASKRMAFGVGAKSTRIAEGTIYAKLRSLENKGYIELRDVTRAGTLIHLRLPSEIPGLVREQVREEIAIENLDFFSTPALRNTIFERDGWKCAYCLRRLTAGNAVLDHILSRPAGSNSFRNLIASCARCNSRKGADAPDHYLRRLLREEFLTEIEFQAQLRVLRDTQQGMRPPATSTAA